MSNLAAAIRDEFTKAVRAIRALTIGNIDVVIESPLDQSYPIITASSSRYKVLAMTSHGVGAGTLSPAIDEDIDVDGALDLTLSGTNGTRWSATVRLRWRVL